jgi:integrase
MEALAAVRANEIQYFDKRALLELQSNLGLGAAWGIIEFPLSWLPPGVCSSNGTRIVDLRFDCQLHSISQDQVELGILTLTRYALICLLVPVVGPRVGSRLLAPTTISACLKHLRAIVKLGLQKSSECHVGVFSHLTFTDLQSFGLGGKQIAELNRLLHYSARGYWSDVPKQNTSEQYSPAWNSLESESRSDNSFATGSGTNPEPFLPFSDKFIGESGWRMSWIAERLGPLLIPCAEHLVEIYKGICSDGVSAHALESKRSWAASKFLSDYDWIEANGSVLKELPFEIKFVGQGKGSGFCWPPKTHAELKSLVILLETSHLFIILLSTGGRVSEVLSFERGCIVEASDGTLNVEGRTYKLVTSRGGAVRDWPLPELAIFAVHQQERLEKISDAINLKGDNDEIDDLQLPLTDEELDLTEGIVNPIWRRIGTGRRILGDYNNMLKSSIELLGLSEFADGINPHAHRFRKTIARLVALALADAPKILMDLFGHKSIEMTLHYMLTDPLIRAELQEVLKAQTIMLAVDSIEQIDNYGGPAAAKVKMAVEDLKGRLGSEYGASNIRELAEILTLSGTFWTIVRPGVICTKLAQQVGPCTKQVGMPEPSRCRSYCENRLERAALREDVDRSIAQAFQCYEEEKLQGNEIMTEMWLGQVRANMNRFPGIREKWESKLAEAQSEAPRV